MSTIFYANDFLLFIFDDDSDRNQVIICSLISTLTILCVNEVHTPRTKQTTYGHTYVTM